MQLSGTFSQRANTANGIVGAFASSTCENDFIGVATEKISNLLAGCFEGSFRLLKTKHVNDDDTEANYVAAGGDNTWPTAFGVDGLPYHPF
jgi:hypothetical protein